MVQFGRKLKNNRTSHWEREYVDYSALKKLIRKLVAHHQALETRSAAINSTNNINNVSNERTALLLVGDAVGGAMDDDADAAPSFRLALETEIAKVEQFYESKLAEYRRQLEYFDEMARPQLDDRNDAEDDDDNNNNETPVVLNRSLNSDPEEVPTSTFQRLSMALRSRAPSARDERARQRAEAQRIADKRRHAWIELARQLYLLVNYTQLNYTAVIKIVKKYLKTVPGAEPLEKQALLKGALFVEASELHDMIGRVQRTFASEYYDGDLRIANDALLEKQGVDVDWNQFRNGILFGACLTLGMWMIWDIVVDEAQRPNANGSHLWQNPLFRLYRGVFSFLLLEWAWGVLVYVWIHNRVNYVYVLDLETRALQFPHQIFTMASKHTALFFIVFILWYKVTRGDFPDWIAAPWYPFMLMCLFLLLLIFPLSTLRRALPLLAHVLTSPFGRVTFATACIGDLLTSMVKPLYDLAYAGCVFGTGAFLAESLADQQACEHSSTMLLVVKPLITAYPLWLRMHQNLRRYYETRERHPHLPNAFKYAFAHSMVLFGAFNPDLLHFAPDKVVTSTLFLVFFFISTLYTYSWDVSMDWSLMRPKHRMLRAELMFSWRWAYYVAIGVDLVLRFVWTMTLVPFARSQFQNVTLLDFADNFFGPIEIVRRCMWAAFRVENEHLHSTEGYRKRNDVVPLYFETPLTRNARPRPSAPSPAHDSFRIGGLCDCSCSIGRIGSFIETEI
jgi:hypothetical protein